MAKTYAKISELNQDQRNHLAWRLDHKSACGLITACSVARGEHGDKYVNDVFEEYGGMTPHQAKIHALKVMQYVKPVKLIVGFGK